MKEDLGFKGNELVRLQTLYILGAVLGQLPFMYLFTRVPMYYLIPLMDVAWGIFTLLQYRVTTFAELAAYRFLVGWFEAAFFPAIHYIFGMCAAPPRELIYLPQIRFLVPFGRVRSSRWIFLRRTYLGYSHSGSDPVGSFHQSGRHARVSRLALDVYHMCHHYHSRGYSRSLRHTRYSRSAQQMDSQGKGYTTLQGSTTESRSQDRRQGDPANFCPHRQVPTCVGATPARYLLLERVDKHLYWRLPIVAEESEAIHARSHQPTGGDLARARHPVHTLDLFWI